MTLLDHIKRTLHIGPRTRPVLLSDVEPAKPDPIQDREVKAAVARLVASLLELERHSYVVRKELSMMTLRGVSRDDE